MKRLGKSLTITAVILVIAIFSLALSLWFFLPREQVTAIITRELSSRLSQDITMDTFTVGFYPGIEFVTRNVRVVDPLSSREILSAQKVRFDLDLGELLNRRFVVEDITVVSPHLHLIRDASGGWNVENLVESMRSGERKDDTSQPVSWFEFGQVTIKHGSIRISDESLEQQLDISRLKAAFDIREETFSIDSASAVTPALEADLSGTFSQLFKPTLLLDIQAAVDIKKEGPLSGMEAIPFPEGTKIADLALEASGSFKEIALTATFALSPLTASKLKTRGAITGTLQAEEGFFKLGALKTQVGKSALSLSGTVSNLWHKERTADLKGTTAISLEEITKLTKRAAPADLKTKGVAEAAIALAASAGQIDLAATIDLLRTDLTLPRFFHKKRGEQGTLTLKARYTIPEEKLTLDPLTLAFGGNTLSLSGMLDNLWQQERTADLKGTTAISLGEVAWLADTAPLAPLKIKGAAEATIALAASPERVGLTTTIDLANTHFVLPRVMEKKRGAPGTLSLDAHYIFPDELVVTRCGLSIDGDTVSGNMEYQPEKTPRFKGFFSTSGFPLQHLNRLPAVHCTDGSLGFSAKVWQSKEGIQFSGDASIDTATLAIKAMHQPLEKLTAQIKADSHQVTLREASFAFGESFYRLDAEVTDFSTPRITGQLRTDLLDIDAIIDAFAEQEDVTADTPPSPLTSPPDFSLELHVSADALHFGKVKTGAVSTLWQTSGRVQQFDPLHIAAFGGTLGGTFELSILEDATTWKTDLKGEEMILEEIRTQLFEESERVKGILSARGTLSGRADDNPAEMWRSINGELAYSVTRAQFNQSPLFQSMLLATRASGMLIPGLQQISMANMLIDVFKSRGRTFNVNQIYFHAIDGTVHITDGLAHTEDSFFNGDAVNLLFTGDIDLVKEEYNMKARATPMGTIGTLVGKIPLLGKQIDRLRNATLSFSFHVTGPFADPNVQLTAVERLTPKKND